MIAVFLCEESITITKQIGQTYNVAMARSKYAISYANSIKL